MSFQSRRLNKGSHSATAPVTEAGKAISWQNARNHGLNALPDDTLVFKWFNVILNNYENDFEEPNVSNPLREPALRLAIAEARYHRDLQKVATHDKESNSA